MYTEAQRKIIIDYLPFSLVNSFYDVMIHDKAKCDTFPRFDDTLEDPNEPRNASNPNRQYWELSVKAFNEEGQRIAKAIEPLLSY